MIEDPYIELINAQMALLGLMPVNEVERGIVRESLIGTSIWWDRNMMTNPCWAAVDAFATARGIIFKQLYLGGNNAKMEFDDYEL